MDLRLLRFMLRLPAIPWCRSKYLLRRAMRGVLPDLVLRRPKSPLTSDREWEGARRTGLPRLVPAQSFSKFVDSFRVPSEAGPDMFAFRVDLRPRGLNFWLRNLRIEKYYSEKGDMQNELIPRQIPAGISEKALS